MTVDILLAVYNGSKFIKFQLDSILKQTYTDWRLLIQDDCSTDNTVEILQAYVQKYPDKMEFYQNSTNTGSAAANFFRLLKRSNADYVMACDQDDVWLPDKIKLTFNKMQKLEQQLPPKTPVLVHTDLKPVDSELHELSPSMFRSQNLDFRRDKLNYLLAQNMITGCTMMVNRALLDLCADFPSQAIMHDWWLGLLASAFGAIGFIDQPTLLYRQHTANQVGAKDVNNIAYIARRAGQGKSNKQLIQDTYMQAQAFFDLYGSMLDGLNGKIVQAYATMPNVWKGSRIVALLQYKLWKYGFVRKIGQIIYC